MKTPKEIITECAESWTDAPHSLTGCIIRELESNGYAFVQSSGFRGLTIDHDANEVVTM